MDTKNIKPSKLKNYDTIGLVSSSAPIAGLVPHRVKNGIKMLNSLGFKTKIGKSALKIDDYVAGTPSERANDINSFIKNKNIKAIFNFIGGNHSNQLLGLLNYKNIQKNPKIIMGYSDATVLLIAIYVKTGLITFYGPSVLNQFAENPKILDYTLHYFRKAVMSKNPIGKIEPSIVWTDELLDWFRKEDITRPRKMRKNSGWIWLKKGKAKEVLIGGCIASLMHLRGTQFWPNFKNKILFWEISESESSMYKGDPLSNIDSYLADLENSKVFEQITGMIIGRPYRYTGQQEKELINIIKTRMKKYNFPILYRVDFGHTDPMITIPIGAKAAINSQKNIFEIIESGVK